MADDWYYSIGGQKSGPVSAAQLKGLAESGDLKPTDLVWRDGMGQWAVAKAVRGLFATAATATAAATSRTAPASTASADATGESGADPRGEPDAFTASGFSPSRFTASHPLDAAIDWVRSRVPPELAEHLSRLAGIAGVYLLYVAAALIPIGGVLLAIRTNRFSHFAMSIALGAAVVVGQYVAYRLMNACTTAVQTNRSVLSSYAIPDCAFVVIVAATLFSTLTLLYVGVSQAAWAGFFGAAATLAVGIFSAMVACQPSSISVFVDDTCRAGQDTVGLLTFSIKMLLYYLSLDVITAIVSTPAKLDAIAKSNGRADTAHT